MKKREVNLMLKIGLLTIGVALIAVCIFGIIASEDTTNKIMCAVIMAVVIVVEGYLLFCTKGIYMDESNKEYRDKVYMKNKPTYIPTGEKFLEIAAIDDIVSKAVSVKEHTKVSGRERCPICGKEVVRGQTSLFYSTETMDESKDEYWGDEFGNFVSPVYEINQHVNENHNAVQIKCTACKFSMTVGWGEKTEKDSYGDRRQMPTMFARIRGVNLCQASNLKLEKELKRADGIELMR